MYSGIFEHLLLPIVERKYGMSVRKHLHELEETQWWSLDKLQELQDERLHRLIKHVYEKVPYYRSIFQERGLTPKDIQFAYDLPKLPILTKKHIRNNTQKLLASDFQHRKPKQNVTSGSTAERLEFYIDWESWSMSWACTYLGWRIAGYKFGDKMASFADFYLYGENMAFRERVRLLLERTLALSVMSMDDDVLGKYSILIAKHQPRFIRGYPSGLYILAQYLRKNNLAPVEPKAVFTTAEALIPKQRQLIEEVFKCRVFDGYGCGDGGGSAIECSEHNGHHIPVQRVVTEFVDDAGQTVPTGRSGKIVLTDLFNYSMPFIRYEVGDRGTLSDQTCPCGRGMPLIKSLDGRISDIIRFRDGTTLSGLALTTILEHLPIRQYQIVQLDMDNLLIRIVRDKTYTEEASNHIFQAMEHHLGRQVDVKLEHVEEIPPGKTGKRLSIISNVHQN